MSTGLLLIHYPFRFEDIYAGLLFLLCYTIYKIFGKVVFLSEYGDNIKYMKEQIATCYKISSIQRSTFDY